MTRDDLRHLRTSHNFRLEDLAWIMGATVHLIDQYLYRDYPISPARALILHALDEGRIDVEWIAKHLGPPPP